MAHVPLLVAMESLQEMELFQRLAGVVQVVLVDLWVEAFPG